MLQSRPGCSCMRLSGREGKQKFADTCVVVDGYNVIGRRSGGGLAAAADLETARGWLLEAAAAYHADTGEDVILVYDAKQPGSRGSVEHTLGVQVVYASQQETADQRIERLVYELSPRYRQVVVATSDAAEQQVAFGAGALRISADEWLRRLEATERRIQANVKRQNESVDLQRARLGEQMKQDIRNILEKWRRE